MEVVKDHENRTATIEDTIMINLGTTEELQQIKIGKSLREFMDVFAWSCKDMLGID